MCLIGLVGVLVSFDKVANVQRGDVGYRARSPFRFLNEYPTNISLDLAALALASKFVLDKVLGDRSERIFLPPLFKSALAVNLVLGVLSPGRSARATPALSGGRRPAT